MPDVQEVFRMATEKVRPDAGFTERQFQHQRRRQRNRKRGAFVVVAAICVVLAMFFLRSGPDVRRFQPATSTSPSVGPNPIGLVGLAPIGATPSSPQQGELVFRFTFGHTMGDAGRFSVLVYADGRLIWQRLGDRTGADEYSKPSSTGWLEQRLTPEGVELVKAEVLSTGLFDQNRNLLSGEGLSFGQVEVHQDDRVVRVTWGDVLPEDVVRTVPTLEQANALRRLDARLAEPESWLPATAWVDSEITAYVPSGYSVCYEADQGVGLSRVLASFPQQAEDLLSTLDRTTQLFTVNGLGSSFVDWCSKVSTEEARALAQILDDAGWGERHEDVFGLRYVFGRDSGATEVSLMIEALLPDQT